MKRFVRFNFVAVSLLPMLLLGLSLGGCKSRKFLPNLFVDSTRSQSESSDSIITRWLVSGDTNRDSLLARLFRAGKIGGKMFYENRPTSELLSEWKKSIERLRIQLPYKFPLDYLAMNLDSTTARNSGFDPDMIGIEHSDDPRVLEMFAMESYYELYRYFSFDGRDTCFLLATSVPGFAGFDLFSSNSGDTTHTDKLELPREGQFSFDTLNGGKVIKIYFPTWGTGAFEKNMEIASVMSGRFRLLYGTTLAAQESPPWSEFPMRIVTKVNFVDVNHDGYLDIVEETTVDSVAELAPNPREENAVENIPSIKTMRKVSGIFLWDLNLCTFIEEKPRGS